ncbi:hypothetical protein QYF36_002870 [Acer negundo]|nr:hypothetical protein QYF36_002870 [Acer negundo]
MVKEFKPRRSEVGNVQPGFEQLKNSLSMSWKVDREIMVKVGARSFPVRLKENLTPVTMEWVNNFLGLKPEPKNLNLNPQTGKVDSSLLLDDNEFPSYNGCQNEGDIFVEKVRASGTKEKKKSSNNRRASEMGNRKYDKNHLSKKYGDREKEVGGRNILDKGKWGWIRKTKKKPLSYPSYKAVTILKDAKISNQMEETDVSSSSSESESDRNVRMVTGECSKSRMFEKIKPTVPIVLIRSRFGPHEAIGPYGDSNRFIMEIDENTEDGKVRSPSLSESGSRSDNSKALEKTIFRDQIRHEAYDEQGLNLCVELNSNKEILKSVIVAKESGFERRSGGDSHASKMVQPKSHSINSRRSSTRVSKRMVLEE